MRSMQVFEFKALGTHWRIEPLDTPLNDHARQELLTCAQLFESMYSRFKPDSLLSGLNTTKELANPPPEMVHMIRFALDMYTRTDGICNISVGSRLEQLGYGLQPDANAEIATNLTDSIRVSDSSISLAPTIRLDFGGFGKGWLVDKLGDMLIGFGNTNFVINGGGDILVHSDKPVEIVIEHPYDPTLGIGTVSLTHGSLASSSSRKRSWTQADGQTAHHIIHPATGQPSSTFASVHVNAPTALIADTLGTVMLLATPAQRHTLSAECNASLLGITHDLQFIQDANFPATMHTM